MFRCFCRKKDSGTYNLTSSPSNKANAKILNLPDVPVEENSHEERAALSQNENNITPKQVERQVAPVEAAKKIQPTDEEARIETEIKVTSSTNDRKTSSIEDELETIHIDEELETKPVSPALSTSKQNSLASTKILNDESDSDSDNADNASITKRRSGLAGHATNFEKHDLGTVEIKKHDKTSSDEELIKAAVAQNGFLHSLLERARLQAVIDAMYPRDVKKNEIIIKEGSVGTQLYISAGGRYEVTIKEVSVATFEDYRVFGELAILYDAKRQATIKALKNGRIWVLDQNVYQRLMLQSEIEQQDELVQFLRKVPKLNTVSIEVLRQVANLLQREFYAAGTRIVQQGDTGDKFYIISAGVVVVSKEDEGEIGDMERGEYFGELALLNDDLRQATVTARAPGVECFSLSRQQFIDHFGNVEDIGTIPEIKRKSTAPLMNPYQDIGIYHLKRIGILGVGGFGRVELVQHREHSHITFALKYLKKIDMIQQQQQEHAYNEKKIQISCNSDFIVRMYKTYRDNKYLYFLMEPCLGGDLWSLLQKQKGRRFDDSAARYYAASVLEALAYLHERGIVYRDLKPENLLLDTRGYLKLTDFGFAKKLGHRGKTYTFAGTPEYVAPEIILTRGHDRAVDYWALGIFIFELLVGRTPFRSSDPSYMKTYNLILRGIENVKFPEMVSRKGENLIKKLCRSIATERLGCLKEGPQAIRNHKWFTGFNWEQLRSSQMKAPFKRTVKGNTDLQNFDKYERDNDVPPDELSGWDKDF